MEQDRDVQAFHEALEENRRQIRERRQLIYAEHATFIPPNRKAYLRTVVQETFQIHHERKG